jgi:hypothetical protein
MIYVIAVLLAIIVFILLSIYNRVGNIRDWLMKIHDNK